MPRVVTLSVVGMLSVSVPPEAMMLPMVGAALLLMVSEPPEQVRSPRAVTLFVPMVVVPLFLVAPVTF